MKSASAPMFIRCFRNQAKVPHMLSLIPNSTISASESLKRRLHFYHPEADGGISILDDTLGIDWRIPTAHANLSEKDTKHAMLKDFDSPFDINVDLYK